ncbi:hypothetical protein IGI04_030269 [Brassica rapa subsp. trilocularis]|uniref:Uncharacterized protein n=1 Tax=Brassica rapa subsp. trilocularis TaxID=1813537 RepID=A0ABQ7LQ76_BRACM|nr:hypothetical protein IGI04_030269 [Brassica rapa subsp. trilocularis]
MFRDSVSIYVRSGMSIDVGWVWAVDRRVVFVDGGRRVSVDEQVLLSIDAVRLPMRMLSLVGPEKVSVNSNNGVSIDTPFSPWIDATSDLSIDVPSRECYARV